MAYLFKQLQSSDLNLFKDLISLFGDVFKDYSSYQEARPDDKYLKEFLSNPTHFILATIQNNSVVGGLVGYELKKFERKRSEIYIYDLAVSPSHQRQGVATNLINQLKVTAKKRGIATIFLQADKIDQPALAFYRSLCSKEEETYNFDFEV